jgi:hypothetical protein
MFLGDLKRLPWYSDDSLSTKTVRKSPIGLAKIRYSTDSLQSNEVIWRFGEKLSPHFYQATQRTERLIATYSYEIDESNKRLRLFLEEGKVQDYYLGFISTGTFLYLWEEKGKKTKTFPTQPD